MNHVVHVYVYVSLHVGRYWKMWLLPYTHGVIYNYVSLFSINISGKIKKYIIKIIIYKDVQIVKSFLLFKGFVIRYDLQLIFWKKGYVPS